MKLLLLLLFFLWNTKGAFLKNILLPQYSESYQKGPYTLTVTEYKSLFTENINIRLNSLR